MGKGKKIKKFTKVTYIYHRILLGIVFVVSLIGLFLNEDDSVKSDYIFNCTQSGLFLIVSMLPLFLKKLELDIPEFVYLLFIIFCISHFLFGEIMGFFVKVSWWDSALHTFSGMLIALLSFSLVNLLNKDTGNDFKLSTTFTVIFAFAITMTIGALWEILEFACDNWFGLNMQRTYISSMSGRGEALEGVAAVSDTMKDLILDAIGAAVVCTTCAVFVAKKKVKIEDLTLIRKKKRPVKNIEVVSLESSETTGVDATIESLSNIEKTDKNKKLKRNKKIS